MVSLLFTFPALFIYTSLLYIHSFQLFSFILTFSPDELQTKSFEKLIDLHYIQC